MNTQLLISIHSLVEMMKDNQKLFKKMATENEGNENDFKRGIGAGIEVANYDFEIARLDKLVSQALKNEGLDFLIEDVQLDGMGSEEIA